MAYCHAKNIVHRDLKPENLLIDEEDESTIKIIDFGTSQVFDPEKKMDQTYGTAYYIAPEVLQHKYDEKCDVWSIGVIMYILLTGRPPFDGGTDNQIIKKVQQGKYPTKIAEFKPLSKDAKDLIGHLLKYKPADRLTASEALEHNWFKANVEEEGKAMEQTLAALDNLKNFRAEQKLQQAALTFIVS